MISLFNYVRAILVTRDRGASAAEYAMLIAAIAAIIAVVVFALGNTVLDMFNDTCQQINTGNPVNGQDC
jgi:pilus assembly protein Flp/PilA